MPSHLSKKSELPDFVLPENVSFNDIKGNQWADDICGKAAKNATLPMHITTPIIYYKNLIGRIQRRLVSIICALPNRNKHAISPKKAPIPHDDISTLIDKSEHVLFQNDETNRVHCTRCSMSFSLRSPSLRHWLKGKCNSIGSALDRPVPLLFHTVHIKNQSIHSSHKLFKYRDLYYCKTCGAHGRTCTKIQKLASKCDLPTAAGTAFINNSKNGIFPFGYNYSILPIEQSKCLNNIIDQHQQLVEGIQQDASSIPIPGSQSVTPVSSPPCSPLSLPFSPQLRAEDGPDVQLEGIIVSDSD